MFSLAKHMKAKVVPFLKVWIFRVLFTVIDCVISEDFYLFIHHLQLELLQDFVDKWWFFYKNLLDKLFVVYFVHREWVQISIHRVQEPFLSILLHVAEHLLHFWMVFMGVVNDELDFGKF